MPPLLYHSTHFFAVISGGFFNYNPWPIFHLTKTPEEQTAEDGTLIKKRNKVFPIDWERSFGTPFGEFDTTYETDINALHLLSNSTFDDQNEKPAIIPRVPTSGEIITREYYVPDSIVEKGKVK